MRYDTYEPVIGLEIHVQLQTKTKLFSRAPNQFGSEPNTNIRFSDTAQPGSLPLLNKKAVELAVRLGLAIGSKINLVSRFDRKSYFYPDSPRNYQITQSFQKILEGGVVVADVDGVTKEFQVESAHIEDDAGMLKHFGPFAGVDLNRAGVPLIEIVSMPCMRTPKEAVAYAQTIKSIMEYIDASDCNMEEGSLRIDVNISVRKKGEEGLRPKIEIKNMNSFSNMLTALDYEIRRQIRVYEENPTLPFHEVMPNSTYRFDPVEQRTVLMRKKETAADYRYFPDPDLPPLVLTQSYVDEIKKHLPELPHKRFLRYTQELGLSEYSASVLIADRALSNAFEKAIHLVKNPVSLCNWLTVEFVGRLNEDKIHFMNSGIAIENVAYLVVMIENGVITGKIAKEIKDQMCATKKHPQEIYDQNPDYKPLSDTKEIEAIISDVLKENPSSVQDYKNGIQKAFNSLVGQVMKKTKGKANPEIVNSLLIATISKAD
ncbi:MAG: Asp-tRNA(Asn)/Glu-tRNA(Gln) amidotransferase subunit GatB [Chlamydiia bacterium]